jgi:hypothetical protein
MSFRAALLRTGSGTSKWIAAHRNRRRQTLTLMAALQNPRDNWLIDRSLRTKLFVARAMERRAVRGLIKAAPRDHDEALEKLRYSISFMIADGRGIARKEIDILISTLQPFQNEIELWLIMRSVASSTSEDNDERAELVRSTVGN